MLIPAKSVRNNSHHIRAFSPGDPRAGYKCTLRWHQLPSKPSLPPTGWKAAAAIPSLIKERKKEVGIMALRKHREILDRSNYSYDDSPGHWEKLLPLDLSPGLTKTTQESCFRLIQVLGLQQLLVTLDSEGGGPTVAYKGSAATSLCRPAALGPAEPPGMAGVGVRAMRALLGMCDMKKTLAEVWGAAAGCAGWFLCCRELRWVC